MKGLTNPQEQQIMYVEVRRDQRPEIKCTSVSSSLLCLSYLCSATVSNMSVKLAMCPLWTSLPAFLGSGFKIIMTDNLSKDNGNGNNTVQVQIIRIPILYLFSVPLNFIFMFMLVLCLLQYPVDRYN